MVSYGWTLEQVLDLTYPQIKTFYRALLKWPTVNMIASAIVNQTAGGDALDKIGKMKPGSVSVVDGSEGFLKALGITDKAEG